MFQRALLFLFSLFLFACTQPATPPMPVTQPRASALRTPFSYTGDWTNDDPNTRGVIGFAVRTNGGQPVVAMQGRCHPTPCQLPETLLQLYASSVSSPADVRAAGTTVRTDFSETFFAFTPLNADRLRVDAYERFTDRSGRAAYTWSETFSRR